MSLLRVFEVVRLLSAYDYWCVETETAFGGIKYQLWNEGKLVFLCAVFWLSIASITEFVK